MRWCEGLPERATRPLTASEHARLEAELGSARRRAAVSVPGLLLPPALVVAGFAFAGALIPEGWARAVVGLALPMLAMLVGIPVSILACRDAFRRLRVARSDLRRGEVVEFSGGGRTLLVLPGSDRALFEDGLPLRRPRPVHLGDAAPVPEDRPTYAVTAADVPEEYRQYGWVRRPLASEERDEARLHARTLARPPRALVVLTAIGALLAGRAALMEGITAHLGPASAWAIGLGLGWLAFLRRRRLAALVSADVEEGWVLRATAGEAVGQEVLPGSGLVWAAGGAPAGWRLRKRAR